MMGEIQIISASAGSGKTHRLAKLIEAEIREGRVRPEAVVATTFTNKAAAELQERVRTHLMKEGLIREAQLLMGARFGTVNSVCGRLLSEFTFELGLSPSLRVLDEEKARRVLKSSLEDTLTGKDRDLLDELSLRWESLHDDHEDTSRWMNDVSSMVELARSNRIGSEELEESAPKSSGELLQLLDEPAREAGSLERELVAALKEFTRNVAGCGDNTGDTTRLVRTSERVMLALEHGELPAWSNWLRLAEKPSGKGARKFVEAIRRPACAHLSHPVFHSDIENMTRLFLSLASRVIRKHQQYKRERGMIDFTDQEVFALSLLSTTEAGKRLKGQIDLVLVDEFQDTSPIQLAIFLKLAGIAGRSVWVGDQKQAIYGFRGTDPALMDAAIDSIVGDAEPETLSSSFRSRPNLVRLTSEIFARAFHAQGMSEKRVRLEPELKEDPGDMGPVIERWVTKSKKTRKADVFSMIAEGVKRLLYEKPVMVRQEREGPVRPARPCDVAVLCRTNSDCDKVANALETAGMRATRPRGGLLSTHEGRLMLSGLRLWVDPEDRLARAELLRLLHYPDKPDEWLQELLVNASAREATECDGIARLLEAREQSPLAGALAAFELVSEALQARELCLAWGDSPARLANLDALREHAACYINEGATVAGGASPAGLVAYLGNLRGEKRDAQAAVEDERSVKVSTWHSAKGLEWPIVVLHGIEKLWESEPFGVSVIPESEEFDFEDPLAGRWIRYWPRPYYAGQKNCELFTRVARHAEGERASRRGRRESLRLLYVIWTRARDRLILAAEEGKLTSGILGLLNREEELLSEPELPEENEAEVKVSWAGFDFEMLVRRLAPAEPRELEPEAGEGYVVAGPQKYPPAWLSPSDQEEEGSPGEPEIIGEPKELAGKPDPQDLGHAVHGFLAADRRDYPGEERLAMAEGLLRRWGVAKALEAEQLKLASDALFEWAGNHWPGARWYCEMPLMHRTKSGSVVRGECDLALETNDGWVVIDHKTFSGKPDAAPHKAASYAGQLYSYAAAIEAAGGKRVLGCFVHMPLLGMVIGVNRQT